MIEGPLDVLVLIILLVPLIAAAYLAIAKADKEVDRIKRFQTWIVSKYDRLNPERAYNKYFFRPFLWSLKPIASLTNKIPDPHWSASAWVFSTGYLALLLIFAALVVGWVLIVAALFIGALMLVLAILGESSDDDTYEPRRERYSGMPSGDGRSVERDGFFGKYVEHQDADGNVVGESREQEGFFGTYTEHRDVDGNVVGESREHEGFFEDYVEHRDNHGNVVGESVEREGFFGDYTEHRDADGNVVAESREREGFFEDYAEHEKK